MTKHEHVVVWDPSGKYWDGAIVSQDQAMVLRSKGACTLPCVPQDFGLAGFAGYAKRSWGAGWPMEGATPRLVAPILLFFPPSARGDLHWAARLYPMVKDLASPENRTGQIALASAPTQQGQVRASVAEGSGRVNRVEIPNLGAPDAHGGWTVGGRALTGSRGPGVYGLGIYGYAPGMRLAWLAVTLTP